MRYFELFPLSEAPIEDFDLVGDFSKNSSFRHEVDRRILTTPRHVERIKQKWFNTPVPFNMIFVNHPEVNNPNLTEVGLVTNAWLEKNMPKTYPQLRLRDDAINVIYTNNKGSERAPVSGWILAHRFGHALRMGRSNVGWNDAFDYFEQHVLGIAARAYGELFRKSYYGDHEAYQRKENFLKSFYQAIGTMHSARTKNVRNEGEFFHELLAQYIVTGKITFHSPPRSFRYGPRGASYAHMRAGQEESAAQEVQELASGLCDNFESMLHETVGKTFVM